MLAAIGLVPLFAFGLSWIWIIFGMKVKTPESVMTTSFVFLMPLDVPDATSSSRRRRCRAGCEAFVRHNPVTHLTTASRGLMGGDAETGSILISLLSAGVLTAVFAPLTVRLYRKA